MTPACDRCGRTAPTPHSPACARRQWVEDAIIELALCPLSITLWPIGTALEVWDRFWMRPPTKEFTATKKIG